MTLKKVSLFVFILISLDFYGQAVNNEPAKSIVTVSLFSPLLNYAPRWNVGYIKKINEQYWVGIDFGYGNANTAVNFAKSGKWIHDNYQLFEIRPEIYYDLNPKSKLKHLISVELFYINHKDSFKNSTYFDTNENSYYHYDTADYSRIKSGLNVNYNMIFNIYKNLAFMQKIGVGFRQRNVTYTNIINKVENLDPYPKDNFIPFNIDTFIKETGIKNSFNLNLELKLIYKF